MYNFGSIILKFTFIENMAEIKRYLEKKIIADLEKRKIILIYGARQVGKTTLVKKFFQPKTTLYLNGDFIDDQEKLDAPTRKMVDQFSGLDTLIIDEAQNIPDIGLKLKVIYDTLPRLRIITTGSSSFELASKVNEPLTGRSAIHMMFPVAYGEAQGGAFDLESALVYGMYPEVFLQKSTNEKRNAIERIAESYLFKDVLNIEYIKNAKSLERLLKVLASQVGSEVSFLEIANTIDLDAKTVAAYLDILEKLFIVFPLYPLASNVRKSITKKRKYYFYDLGIRNAILGNFSFFETRTDKGALWENFVIVERMKANEQKGIQPQYYFFRTYKGEEIDFIEKMDTQVCGFECKYLKGFVSQHIQNIYTKDLLGSGKICVINKGNVQEFLL